MDISQNSMDDGILAVVAQCRIFEPLRSHKPVLHVELPLEFLCSSSSVELVGVGTCSSRSSRREEKVVVGLNKKETIIIMKLLSRL